MNKTYLE